MTVATKPKVLDRKKYVCAYLDRHGVLRVYYRRLGIRVALPADSGDDTLLAAYHRAVADDAERLIRPVSRKSKLQKTEDFEEWALRAYQGTRRRAKEKGMEFDLGIGFIARLLKKQDHKCAVTGVAFSLDQGKARNPLAPSVDRKDPRFGYTKTNVRIVLLSVNLALNNWGDDHYGMIAEAYVRQKRQ